MRQAEREVANIVAFIQDLFAMPEHKGAKAVIGLSGGKDSTVCAYLLVKALGKENVVGVLMPDGKQADIDDSLQVAELLKIPYRIINIQPITEKWYDTMREFINCRAPMVRTNLPARVRMTVLYGVAADYSGRVVNTCNASEDYVGFATKFGDGAGDFSLLTSLTVTEILAIGEELEIPRALLYKDPSDGMCGQTDEDVFGFKYRELDSYLLDEDCQLPEDLSAKIEKMHKSGLHKIAPRPEYWSPLRELVRDPRY